MLRIDFGDRDERLQPIEWDRFFELFDASGLAFLYDPDGHMNKFIQVGEDQTGIGMTEPRGGRRAASRGASATRKKSTSSKKSTNGRKKSASRGRKKSTNGRKKSSS